MGDQPQYAPLQKALHWITVCFVAVLVPLGFYMVWRYTATDNDALTVALFDIHKLLGFLLLWIVALRLAVRLTKGVPPPPPSLALPQRLAAETVHWLIYALLVALPISGWIGASAYEILSLPGGLRLPAITAKDGDFAGRVFQWHLWGAVALCLLVGAHAGAALMHKIVFKDGIFERMWPGRGQDRNR